MKSPILALALLGTLAVFAGRAQAQPPGPAPGAAPPPYDGAAGAPSAGGNQVVEALNGVPPRGPAGNLQPPPIPQPIEPIEPYLLTKEVGPFMVLARVFRGPDAQQMALALVKELRNDFGLPAFILRTKDFPGKSLIRGTPPQAPSQTMAPDIKLPEKIRTFDETAVLVGNEKTFVAQEKLWRYVKKLKPKCLVDGYSPAWRHSGLSTALRTTNPYVPAQYLFPQARDRLVIQVNSGFRSIANCPGRYSLQVAEFRRGADEAERLADKLAKDPTISRLRQPVYVYHDRTSSKVFIGSFDDPRDTAAAALRNQLAQDAPAISSKNNRGKTATDTMIVPALALTDLSEIKTMLKN
jgi:hypothetical protein